MHNRCLVFVGSDGADESGNGNQVEALGSILEQNPMTDAFYLMGLGFGTSLEQ